MKNSTAYYDEEQELFEEEQERRDKKARRKKVQRVIDRIFGFILATGILFGVAGLAVEYVLVKGPSPALRNMFINTMLETRRFGFIANVYLSEDEVKFVTDALRQLISRDNESLRYEKRPKCRSECEKEIRAAAVCIARIA